MVGLDELLEAGDLFSTSFPEGWQFTWRLLTLKEFRVFSALKTSGTLHSYFVHRKVFEKCYVGDPNLLSKKLPLGVTVSIGGLIMYLSGECAGETSRSDLEVARASYPAQELTESMKRIICVAFPNTIWEDFDKMNRLELIRKFVISEELLKERNIGYNGLDLTKIITSSEAAVEEAKETYKPVNFDTDNQMLSQQLSPFDMEDIEQYGAPQRPSKLSVEHARKLDALRQSQK